MNWNHYRFRSVWDLPAPPDTVYAVLARPEEYPSWWPQVRRTVLLDERTGVVRIRSVLPYDIVVTLAERRRDPAARVLETTLDGDLRGWARWTVTGHGTGGARALYEQEVEVRRPLMRRLAVPGRPAFLVNHRLMMRAGRRGLAAGLAGGLNTGLRDL
ncbi:SRPBCC family protein [Streptomyces sp. HMX112]|uniref:SRPBCC family protein n=1 Tax=Streptomyces sp. HMX112 TaxID=3390850 RepID=UPI003A802DB5